MKYRALVLAGMVAVGVVSGYTTALTQGTTGMSSEGSLSIQLSIPPLVKIQGLQDIDLGTYTGAGDLQGASNACVKRNGAGAYSVTATSINAFALTGSARVPYGVTWGGQPLGQGVVLAGQIPEAVTLQEVCGATAMNKIGVRVQAADLLAAPSGAYTDTLTLIVVPE